MENDLSWLFLSEEEEAQITGAELLANASLKTRRVGRPSVHENSPEIRCETFY